MGKPINKQLAIFFLFASIMYLLSNRYVDFKRYFLNIKPGQYEFIKMFGMHGRNFLSKMFSGSKNDFHNLFKDIKYPEKAKNNCIQGSSEIYFEIDYQGNIKNITTSNEFGYGVEEKIIEIIKSTKGKWKKNDFQTDIPVVLTIEFKSSEIETPDDFCKRPPSRKADIVLLDEIIIYANNQKKDGNRPINLVSEHAYELFLSDKYKEAIPYFDTLVNYDNCNKYVLYYRGLVKKKVGDINGACEDWKPITDFVKKKTQMKNY